MLYPDLTGRSLLHYRLTCQIGQGGMGVVYRAHDTRLNRPVAVKVLSADSGKHPRRRDRFLREAQSAAGLNHPNIVGIYEIGSEGDIDFIAMELVEGKSLAQLLRLGRVPLVEALSYSSQIASALVKAHAAGIVHRDLKPANAMVNADGLVKLLDFGLAQINLRDPATGEDAEEMDTVSQITQAGTVVGTVAYMSPEQVRGKAVDLRSDMFSFGVMLYEMLSGVRPFAADNTAETLHNTMFEKPRPIRDLCTGLPRGLPDIVARCLEKEPAARYPNMEPVAEGLRNLLRALESQSGAFPPQGLAPHRSRRKIYAGAALAAALLVGAAFTPAGQGLLSSFRSSPLAAAMHLPSPAAKLCRDGSALLLRFDRPANVDGAVEAFQKAISVDRNHAPAYAGLAMAYAQKFVDNPDPQWRRMAETAAARAMQINSLLAAAHVAQGRVLLVSGKYAEAEKPLRRALELEPRNPDALLNLGSCQFRRRQLPEAEATFVRMNGQHPDDWRGYHYLGALLINSGRQSEAIARLTRAEELAPDNIAVLKLLGSAYVATDRLDDAAAVLQKALAVQPSTLIVSNLGDVYFKAGRYADAVEAFRQALTRGGNTYLIWGNLGDALRFTPGKGAEAKEAYRQAVRLLEQQMETATDDVRLRSFLALYLASAGDKQRAQRELDRLRQAEQPDGLSLYLGGVAAEMVGRRADALAMLSRAVAAHYSLHEIEGNPDLMELRQDARYHLTVARNEPPAQR